MTLQEFSDIFALLAVQLRQTDADEVTIRAYYQALKDEDAGLLGMAATELAATAEWFPKTSEWQQAARHIERRRLDQQRQTIRERLRVGLSPLCAECEDTGWSRDEADRVRACGCRKLRRLEVTGRRPMPVLPEHTETTSPVVIDIDAAAGTLASVKGMR